MDHCEIVLLQTHFLSNLRCYRFELIIPQPMSSVIPPLLQVKLQVNLKPLANPIPKMDQQLANRKRRECSPCGFGSMACLSREKPGGGPDRWSCNLCPPSKRKLYSAKTTSTAAEHLEYDHHVFKLGIPSALSAGQKTISECNQVINANTLMKLIFE